jgi:hypothetical protein
MVKGTVCLVLVGAAITASAAFGGSTMTKSQVIARGSAICRAAEHRVDATPGPRSQDPFAANAPKGDRQRALDFMAVYASSLTSVRTGLGRLTTQAPAAGRPLLTSFVAQLGPTIAAFRDGRSAALAHHDAAALADVQRAFTLFAKASAKTKAYGFPKGVCQSGSS